MRPLPPATNAADPGWQRQDFVSRGLGIAAQAMGLTTDVYRPAGPTAPMSARNRLVRLHAAFTDADARFSRPPGYGDAIWYGLFDTAYTRSGDYLRQNDDVWFVASQPRLMPALCVRADRIVSFARPVTTRTIGAAGYSGVELGESQLLLRDWPASLIGATGVARTQGRLPADGGMTEGVVLLPVTPGVHLEPGDVMLNELARRSVVVATELTELGWRLAVRQAIA
jgi:hypothetical protein